MAYGLLKSANCVPEEVEFLKEVNRLRDDVERSAKRIAKLEQKLEQTLEQQRAQRPTTDS